jgi:predicted Zn finger-like uncharacterized protein
MHIKRVLCPACTDSFVVDAKLWSIGTVRLRCGACYHYFLPEDSPRSTTIGEAINAAVPITIWEPAIARDQDTPAAP